MPLMYVRCDVTKAELAVSPTELRKALSALEGEHIFRLGEMNDAGEVLEVLWSCMHEVPLKTEEDIMICRKTPALVDAFFGLDIHEYLHCVACKKVMFLLPLEHY